MSEHLTGQDGNDEMPKEVLNRFLDLQEEELENRRREIEADEKNSSLNHEYAKLALQAQERDRSNQRSVLSQDRKSYRKYYLAGLFAVLLLIGILALNDKEDLVMEIATHLIVAIGGVGIGYALGKRKPDES